MQPMLIPVSNESLTHEKALKTADLYMCTSDILAPPSVTPVSLSSPLYTVLEDHQ